VNQHSTAYSAIEGAAALCFVFLYFTPSRNVFIITVIEETFIKKEDDRLFQ